LPESSSNPSSSLGFEVSVSSFFKSSVRPFAVDVTFCGAGLERMSGFAGKNDASLSFFPVITVMRKPVLVGTKPILRFAGGVCGSLPPRRVQIS
jgi:hypothetical protein